MSTIITGIRPTGDIHIGNYFSAILPIINMQKSEDKIFIFIADLHALVNISEKFKINESVRKLLISYIALGIDPAKVKMFRQSELPEVTTLSFMFSTLLTLPQLEIGHSFKDLKIKENREDFGVLMYPILMSADILLFDTDIVPIGKDQLQHVELTRKIARKFNKKFGVFFKEPKEKLSEVEVLGIDGRKMSKSYNNTLSIFDTEENIKKKIQSIKTTSDAKGSKLDIHSCNVAQIRKYFITKNEFNKLKERYTSGDISYKESKEALLQEFLLFFGDARKLYFNLLKKDNFLNETLDIHRITIREMVEARMEKIYKHIGIL